MRLLPTLAATLLISSAALAQQAPDAAQPEAGAPMAPMAPGPGAPGPGAPHMNLRQRFEAANTTHDGRLTRDQAAGGGMPGIARHFDQIDADRKGYVTLQDLRAWAQARRAARAGQAPAQPPPPPAQ